MKHIVVNKVVEESVQEGYLERLSKGQAVGIKQLEEVRHIYVGLSVHAVYDMTSARAAGSPFKLLTLFFLHNGYLQILSRCVV